MACRWNCALRTVLKLGLLAHTFFPRVVNLSLASLVKYWAFQVVFKICCIYQPALNATHHKQTFSHGPFKSRFERQHPIIQRSESWRFGCKHPLNGSLRSVVCLWHDKHQMCQILRLNVMPMSVIVPHVLALCSIYVQPAITYTLTGKSVTALKWLCELA